MQAELALDYSHSPSGLHSPEWSTPPSLFRELDSEFHFTLDACADSSNAKVKRFFDLKADGLLQEWNTETVWCNPPYGRGVIDRWVRKAFDSWRCGATVVMLLPNSTDTGWYHDYCYRGGAGEVRFIRGRLKFGGCVGTPPFGSIIVIFRGSNNATA